jgi:ABC-type amino acid transport system permease subunit
MAQDLDDPLVKKRCVKVLLVLTPFAFVLCWVLAALQGASARDSTIIGGVAAIGTFGAALSIGLFGSGARWVFTALVLGIALLQLLSR